MEEKNKNVDSIGPKKHVRGIWGVLIIIIVALLVLGGVGYYFYLTDPSQFSALFNRQKNTSISPTPTTTATPTTSATPAGSCTPNTLTAEEQAIVKDWGTHSNTAGKFEFKYPKEWNVTDEYLDMVTMAANNAIQEKFEFLRAESAHVDTAGYRNTNTTPTQVWCINATEKIYEKGSSSPYDYLVVVSFERYGTNYLTYSFKAEGASIAGNYIDEFNALVKTFKFLP